MLPDRRRWWRLRQRRARWHRYGLANAAPDLGVDTPHACGDWRFATKPPDSLIVARVVGRELQGRSPAPMRERPHPGSESGVEIAHALDLRQAMPTAFADADRAASKNRCFIVLYVPRRPYTAILERIRHPAIPIVFTLFYETFRHSRSLLAPFF